MTRPNVLVIMTDHTNAQALSQASPCRTPCLDALAADGVRFGRCYTSNAICSPARLSLMTGAYPSTHGMWDCTHTQRREWQDIPADRWTHFARRFDEAGYRTAYFGKWHVDHSGRLEPYGWQTHDQACGSLRAKPMPGSELLVSRQGYRDYLLAGVSADDATATHPAFDKGIAFLRAHAAGPDAGRPFCCFVSTTEPHDPYIPPRRFLDLYDLDRIPLPPTLREEPAGKPEIVRRQRAVWAGLDDAGWRRARASYWAMISFLDHETGRLLATLQELNLDANTVVVFLSDHGDMIGSHGLVAKGGGTPYEEVYNIPLIIRAPGVQQPREETRALVGMVDIAPTLLDLCGLPPLPEGQVQGRSFRPVLEGRADPADWQDAFAEFFGQRFVYTQRITWHGPWKYVFSPGGLDELYNLENDPLERRNLAEDPSHRAVLLEMCTRMWRKIKAIGDQSLLNSQYATLRTAPIGPESVKD
jgi:arylsulfatase A-like enzyme